MGALHNRKQARMALVGLAISRGSIGPPGDLYFIRDSRERTCAFHPRQIFSYFEVLNSRHAFIGKSSKRPALGRVHYVLVYLIGDKCHDGGSAFRVNELFSE